MLQKNISLYYSLSLGFSYLLYPICGWIADVHISNFKMIKWSFNVVFISSVLLLVSAIWSHSVSSENSSKDLPICICSGLFIVTGMLGLGMYEANAIQFGMDQMLEASSKQLSSFIHWYFWCAHIGSLLFYYLFMGTIIYLRDCKIAKELIQDAPLKLLGAILLIPSSIQIFLFLIILSIIHCRRGQFIFEETRKNPLKIILEVLRYSYKTKYPERRSAFTYWENDVPSRIDLGKEKYGGPFTNEQVEDVKTMFRLLLLIVSLFGYHLSGDGYSLTYHVMNKIGCPTWGPFLFIVLNPQHLPILVVIVGIPLYHLLKKYSVSKCIHTPSLLTRIWYGLLVCLINEAVLCIYSLMLQNKGFDCNELNVLIKPSLLSKCMAANTNAIGNDSCKHFCTTPPVSDPLIYLSLVPQLMNGLSYLLVFMTTHEFICAQSPNAMKGLLIGIWYSMLCIKSFSINILDVNTHLLNTFPWVVYHGVKGVGIFMSIVFFSMVWKMYKYRERDEIVNEQAIIEEQYERELLLNYSNAKTSSHMKQKGIERDY